MKKMPQVQNDSFVKSYPEWHFNVLTTPYFHFLIIASNMVEIFFRDGEQTTSKRGSPTEKYGFSSTGMILKGLHLDVDI